MRLIGVQIHDDIITSVTCTSQLTIEDSVTVLTNVTDNGATTPSLIVSSIMPRYGSVLGGEQVTYTGLGFTGAVTSSMDGCPCSVDTQSVTEITCTIANKPYVPGEPTLMINIAGVGAVATRGQVYRYVSRWSDKETWGNNIISLEDEAVAIPSGQHLLVDVAAVPRFTNKMEDDLDPSGWFLMTSLILVGLIGLQKFCAFGVKVIKVTGGQHNDVWTSETHN